jgi:hypothetical protein
MAAPVEQSVAASSEIPGPKEWIVQTDWNMLYRFLYPFPLSNFSSLDMEKQIVRIRLEQNQFYDTICLEPILRQDLWEVFLNKVAEIRSGPRGEPPCSTKIEFAFHGTFRECIPSIVQQGFLVPTRLRDEPGSGHASSHAAQLGLGIYCTPDIVKAFQYTSSRIVLCAVIRGKPYHFDRGEVGVIRYLKKGYDSHVFENEWVVFHPEQIVPLCVIHLKGVRMLNAEENDWDEGLEFHRRLWEQRVVDMESICSRKHFQYQSFR